MPSRDSSLSAALADLNKGRIVESIQQLKQIVRGDPTNASAYFYLSTLYTQMGEHAVAERYIQRAIDINPKQGEYYHQLGLIRFAKNNGQQPWDCSNRRCKSVRERTKARVWKSIGDVELELFNRDAALEAYTQALRVQPDDAQTRLALGEFYLERGSRTGR